MHPDAAAGEILGAILRANKDFGKIGQGDLKCELHALFAA
jgi:hypothetical protein